MRREQKYHIFMDLLKKNNLLNFFRIVTSESGGEILQNDLNESDPLIYPKYFSDFSICFMNG